MPIQDLSYYSDSRVISQSKWYESIDEKRMIAFFIDEEENEIEVPFTWNVCPTCGGKGTHVNPSIDSHGISSEDFYDDPDFAESYFNGDYDVECYDCGGRRVVPVCTDPKVIEAIIEKRQFEADCRAEQLAEMRFGA